MTDAAALPSLLDLDPEAVPLAPLEGLHNTEDGRARAEVALCERATATGALLAEDATACTLFAWFQAYGDNLIPYILRRLRETLEAPRPEGAALPASVATRAIAALKLGAAHQRAGFVLRRKAEDKEAARVLKQAKRAAEATADPLSMAATRLPVRVYDRDANDVVWDIRRVLKLRAVPGSRYALYTYGAKAWAQVTPAEPATPASPWKPPRIAMLDADKLRLEIGEHVSLLGPPDQTGNSPRLPEVPPSYVASLLACSDPGLPPLRALDLVPWMDDAGTIHTTPGYNADTGRMLSLPPGLDMPPVPAEPTPADIAAALATLREPLAEFCFSTPADATNALAWLLTGLLRPMIDGPCPLALCTGSTPGLGKGLLQEACALAASGSPASKTTSPRNPEELGKRIETFLCEGAHSVILDDMTAHVDCPHLHAVLTSWPVYTFRKLGGSVNVSASCWTLWAINGNNLAIRKDLGRRVLPVRLVPPTGYESCPHMAPRKRTQADLLSFITARRGALLSAALTLARGWHEAGRPAPTADGRTGSFPAWDATVGGILRHAGVEGLLANRNDEDSRLSESDGGAALMDLLGEVGQGRSWRPLSLVEAVWKGGGAVRAGGSQPDWTMTPDEADRLREAIVTALPPATDARPEGRAKALGWVLARFESYTTHAGWRLEKHTRAGGIRAYVVKNVRADATLALLETPPADVDPTL